MHLIQQIYKLNVQTVQTAYLMHLMASYWWNAQTRSFVWKSPNRDQTFSNTKKWQTDELCCKFPALSPLACALQWLDPPGIPLRNCHCLERPSAFRPGDCANTCPASDFQGPSAPSPAEGKLALGHWHCLTLWVSYIRSPLSQHGLLFNAWSLAAPPPPPPSLSLSLSLPLFILLSTSPQQPSS